MKPIRSRTLRNILSVLIISAFQSYTLAQDDLKWALNVYNKIDGLMIKNQFTKLDSITLSHADSAITTFNRYERRYEQGSLLYYKSVDAYNKFLPQETKAYLDQARNILESNRDDSVSLLCTIRLGNVWSDYGFYYDTFRFDFQRSMEAFQKGLDYYRSANVPERVYESLSNKAATLARFGKAGQALALIEEATRQYDSFDDALQQKTLLSQGYFNYLLGLSYMALSDSLIFTGNQELGDSCTQKAIAYLKSVAVGPKVPYNGYLSAQFALAVLCLRDKTPHALDTAMAVIERIEPFFRLSGAKAESPYGLLEVVKGVTLYLKGDTENGASLITKGLNDLEYPVSGILDKETHISKPSSNLMQALITKASFIHRAYLLEPKEAYLEQMLYDAESIAELAEMLVGSFKDREAFEKLSDRFGFIYGSGIFAAAKLYTLTGDESLKERAFRLGDRSRAMSMRYRMIKSLLPGESIGNLSREDWEQNLLSLKEVQKLVLTPGTSAIFYSVTVADVTAMIITPDTTIFVILPGMKAWKKDMEQMLRWYEESDERYHKQAKVVYDKLMAPLIRLLPTSTDHLIILPDDMLWRINYDALVQQIKGNKPSYLVERYAISLSYSLRVTARMAEKRITPYKTPSLGIFVGHYQHDSIPYTQRATNQIGQAWGEQCVSASPAIFRQMYGAADIMLLAVHGYSQRNMLPENYHIAFGDNSDDKLTLKDIYDFPPIDTPRLVYLASCLTAWGEHIRGEGISSIARAFHFKGVPTLIAPFTKVQDEPIAELTRLYFDQLRSRAGGVSAVKALQIAKKEYIRQHPRAMPQQWAPLVCMGYGNLKL